jgi:hypothetical protein
MIQVTPQMRILLAVEPVDYKESPCITWISARIVTFPYHHRKSSGMKK